MKINTDIMNKDQLNQKLTNVETDSGWIARFAGNCYTTWYRTVKLAPEASVDQILKQLGQNKDYPGWTGVDVMKTLCNNGYAVFSSTYDSGD